MPKTAVKTLEEVDHTDSDAVDHHTNTQVVEVTPEKEEEVLREMIRYTNSWWRHLARNNMNQTEHYILFLVTKGRLIQQLKNLTDEEVVIYITNKFFASFGNARPNTFMFIDRKAIASLVSRPDLLGYVDVYERAMLNLIFMRTNKIGHNNPPV
jgi:hypothetical protein